jgi:hypothetical protein
LVTYFARVNRLAIFRRQALLELIWLAERLNPLGQRQQFPPRQASQKKGLLHCQASLVFLPRIAEALRVRAGTTQARLPVTRNAVRRWP